MAALLIGYARVSTDEQDLTAQRDALTGLGVAADRIYVDHGQTVERVTAKSSSSSPMVCSPAPYRAIQRDQRRQQTLTATDSATPSMLR
jgi:hypothetical protein